MTFATEPHKLRRNDGPDTSDASARATRTGENNARAYYVIQKAGIMGATADDVRREWLELGAHPRASYFPRITNIHEQGLILDTGTRRASDSGRPMAVYVATNLLSPEWIEYIRNHPDAHNPCLHQESVDATS